MNDWIAVTDQLPNPLEDVLITVVDTVDHWVCLAYRTHDSLWWWSGEGTLFTGGRITHWMPLPAPAV